MMGNRTPYFGAVSLHAPREFGRGWFINLYIWRCGPLRLNWYVGRIGAHGVVEIPTQRLPLLHHWLHYLVERLSRSAGAERKRERRSGRDAR